MGYEPLMHVLTNDTTNVPEASMRIEQLEQARKEAHAAIERAAWRMTRNASEQWKTFNKGDKVWLDTRNLKDPTLPDKLKPRKYGPFVVDKVYSKLAYGLKLPKHWKIHPTFHVELLSPYHTNEWYGKPKSAPQPVEIEGQEEFEVEKILDHRKRGKGIEYLIAWKGYPMAERSWEPDKNLTHAPEALRTYWENKGRWEHKNRA